MKITSTGNQRVRELLQLRKKSRVRNTEGVFIAEGSRMTGEAPAEDLVRLYVSETYYKKHGQELGKYQKEPEILADSVFDYVSDTKSPQGILALVRQPVYSFSAILGRKKPLILVLDKLQDPGNLGTIFRTAEAAGVTGILMSRDCVDIFNPKTIRSTMGAVYRLPFLYLEDIESGMERLKDNHVHIYAAHLKGKNVYDKEDYTGGTAFLIGNEGNGLRPKAAQCAHTWVQIPMQGKADSLNAAVAASVLMFEAARQRR